MKRVVKEHFPVSSLPEDLREGFDPNGYIKLTIIAAENAEEQKLLDAETAILMRSDDEALS